MRSATPPMNPTEVSKASYGLAFVWLTNTLLRCRSRQRPSVCNVELHTRGKCSNVLSGKAWHYHTQSCCLPAKCKLWSAGNNNCRSVAAILPCSIATVSLNPPRSFCSSGCLTAAPAAHQPFMRKVVPWVLEMAQAMVWWDGKMLMSHDTWHETRSAWSARKTTDHGLHMHADMRLIQQARVGPLAVAMRDPGSSEARGLESNGTARNNVGRIRHRCLQLDMSVSAIDMIIARAAA